MQGEHVCESTLGALPWGYPKREERVTHGEIRENRQGPRWRGNKGQRTLTNADALANSSPFLSPFTHSLILTLCKRVALCRSAPVLNASNPHPTLHSRILPHSCN